PVLCVSLQARNTYCRYWSMPCLRKDGRQCGGKSQSPAHNNLVPCAARLSRNTRLLNNGGCKPVAIGSSACQLIFASLPPTGAHNRRGGETQLLLYQSPLPRGRRD